MKKIARILLPILFLILIAWFVWGNVTVGVTQYRVASDRLPDAFDGYRIAVISDLHNTRLGLLNDQTIKKTKEAQPDLIAITGDLVDADKTDIDAAAALIRRLTEIAPCFYVTGNHEAHIGQRYDDLESRLIAEAVTVLHDRVIPLTRSGQTIRLAGLEDPDFSVRKTTDQVSALQTKLSRMAQSGEFCVLLSHRPEAFEAYVTAGIDLALCGHTHGGQFRLPLLGGVFAPNQGLFPKYDAGVFSERGTTMIVSRGIGNSVIPVRFNNRPEIVVAELICSQQNPDHKTEPNRVIKWLDCLHGDDMIWDAASDFGADAFPGVVFRWQAESLQTVAGKKTTTLYHGMPIWSVYLCDLTGDGKPELCSTLSFGSGIVASRILIYDYAAGASYELSDRGHFDYSLNAHGDSLIIEKRLYNSDTLVETGVAILLNGAVQMKSDS